MSFEVVFKSVDSDYVVVADVSEETGLVTSVFGHRLIVWGTDHECDDYEDGPSRCRHNSCEFLDGRECEDHCFRVGDDSCFYRGKSLEEVRQMVLIEMEERSC